MKIAIQGISGSYHHIAAEGYFDSEINLLECMTFSEIPELLINKKADAGIMAIENSIAGAILPNYALIEEYNLMITGEFYLTIEHQLMALEGQSFEDIKEVLSHPMALLQCRRYLQKYPHLKLIEDKDTARVAKRIQEEKLKGVAAIGPKLAAEMYGLKILASGIQTIKQNSTRFVVVEYQPKNVNESVNKASIKFEVANRKGCLGEVLNVFSDNNVNLTKIQSLPIIEKPWEYMFFADLVFDVYSDYKNAMENIKGKVTNCMVLGEYLQI